MNKAAWPGQPYTFTRIEHNQARYFHARTQCYGRKLGHFVGAGKVCRFEVDLVIITVPRLQLILRF